VTGIFPTGIRFGTAAAAVVLVIGAIVAAASTIRSPELEFAWAQINAECTKNPSIRDCFDLLRDVNQLRIRTWLVAICFLFGGVIAALGCWLIDVDNPTASSVRQDGRRVAAIAAVSLVALGGVLAISGVVLASLLPSR
jgi:hypothetical protein